MSLLFPPQYYHFELKQIYGDSPYYHISQNNFLALRQYNEYIPSETNPFATVLWVVNQINKASYKSAWGFADTSAGGNIGIANVFINFTTGVISSGSYFGDIGFENYPTIFVAATEFTAVPDRTHGYSIFPIFVSTHVTNIYCAKNRINVQNVLWVAFGK